MTQAVPLLLEAGDAARELGLSYSGIRVVVDAGKLVPCAMTRRGVRLFEEKDVARLKKERMQRKRR